jgi:tight adherence protein C
MYLILLIEIVAVIVLYFISKGKYTKEVEELGDAEKNIKALLPLGLHVASIFNTRYLKRYKQRIYLKIKDLYGCRLVELNTMNHLAKTVLILLFTIMFLSFVGTQIEIDVTYGIFCVVSLGAVAYAFDKQIDTRLKQRKRLIQMDFPDFLNTLVLMVNAGLTVSSAVNRIVKCSDKKRPLYMELFSVTNEINAGKPEMQAYEDFARRCRLQEVTMFVSTLLQNLKKGNDELVPILKLQANTCWEGRKLAARKLGEEASTKLLFPMMLIFVAIMAMVMTPAVLQLNF